MNPLRLSRPVGLIAATVLLLGTAACGGSSEPDVDEDGLRTITVGAAPVVDLAPLVHAQETGLFEEQGLIVKTEPIAGGAEAIPSLMAGDVDVLFTGYTPVLQARQRGLDVVLISGSLAQSGNYDDPYSLWTGADSDVEVLDDLKGKTIAVNTLGSLAHLMVVASMDEIGIEADEYDLLEVPFSEVPAALDEGRVDAGWSAEPFRAALIKADGTFVGSAEDPERMTVAPELQEVAQIGYATRGDEDRDMMEGFRVAMKTAMEQLNEDPQIAIDLALDFAQLPEELADEVAVSTFYPDLTIEDVQKYEDLMVDYGLMDERTENIEDVLYAP